MVSGLFSNGLTRDQLFPIGWSFGLGGLEELSWLLFRCERCGRHVLRLIRGTCCIGHAVYSDLDTLSLASCRFFLRVEDTLTEFALSGIVSALRLRRQRLVLRLLEGSVATSALE